MTTHAEELKKVRTLAKIVRKAMEHVAKWEEESGKIDCLFNDAVNLNGYCARASALLSIALERAGIEHKITGGAGHIFIKWRNHIVDVTATQFSNNLGKTVICKKETLDKKVSAHKRSYWREKVSFDESLNLWDWQDEHDWPECQRTQPYDCEFLEKLKEYKEFQYGIQK